MKKKVDSVCYYSNHYSGTSNTDSLGAIKCVLIREVS